MASKRSDKLWFLLGCGYTKLPPFYEITRIRAKLHENERKYTNTNAKLCLKQHYQAVA